MAIYHLSAGFVSRSTGRSSVQSAAYITGEMLFESRRELVADYRNLKERVLFSTTLFPDKVPESLRNLDIWDKLESFEDRYAQMRYKTPVTRDHYKQTAQSAQTIEIALPKELSPEASQALVLDFAQTRFVARGLVVTVALHRDAGNPHAHLQISRRSLNEQGAWSWAKDRDIVSKSALIETRALWAELSNQALEREGFSTRIDHRSYVEQGIPFIPTQHEGWFAHKLDRLGLSSRIIEDNKAIRAENQTLASLEPKLILEELCAKQATFSSTQLARLVQERVGDEAGLHSIVYEESLRQAIPVGMSLEGQTRYSSPDYVAKEQEALSWVQILSTQASTLAIHPSLINAALEGPYAHLNAEQRAAVHTLCAPFQFGTLIGRAGTGKTTTLEAVVHSHQQAGYTVMGLCLSASAAENLSLEAKIEAETIAFYLDKWERAAALKADIKACDSLVERTALKNKLGFLKPYALSKRHLVLVDEAGMVGTTQWHSLLSFVREAGAKLIGTGDDHQFKAIDGGDFFRGSKALAQDHGRLCALETIQRQREPWMREASLALAELRTYEALAAYENHGLITPLRKGSEGLSSLATQYMDKVLAHPAQSSSLMAYTRAECAALNQEIRLILKAKGLIEAQDYRIKGQDFSVKDKIIFLKNDRKHEIETYDPGTHQEKDYLIKNGTQGSILSIEKYLQPPKNPDEKPQSFYKLEVAIDAHTHARVYTESYTEFNHAYATTLHKSQGRTVDWSMVLLSSYMDAYALYVALTRHRESTHLFYPQEAFANFKALQSSLSRLGHKDLAIDYSIHADHQGAWETVQEYKLLGQDLSATLKEKQWEAYNRLKIERETVGKNILEDWQSHREFARQAGLSAESIAINCGLKARPLSLAEQEAKNTVSLYAEKALEARALWKQISETHPGTFCVQHAEYRAFTELRQARNSLAKTITEYPALHREFVRALGQAQGIGWKTLESQAKQTINFELYDRAQPRAERVENTMNPRAIREGLNENIATLALELLGEPTRKTAREWRYGSQGAISVAVAGTKQGCYANFETGSFGGGLKLIQDHKGLDHASAFQWAAEWLGPQKQVQVQNQTPKLPEPELWTPILPSKKHPLPDQLRKEPALAYQFSREKRTEIERYAYRDEAGHLLGYTVRLEDKEGHKVVLPLSYCENAKGQQQWRWKHFHEGADRPLYGLERLAKYPHKSVLIVEGEKTANKAQKRLPEWVVVSWSGGTSATHKTDFSPLLERTINLWPDNDAAGIKAMDRIADHLIELHQEKGLDVSLNIVSLDDNIPLKWDLADPLPKGLSLGQIKALIADPPKEEEKVQTPTETLTDRGVSLEGSFKKSLKEYGLDKISLSQDFLTQTRALYHELLAYHALSGQPCWPGFQELLMERAVLAQALMPLAKDSFYPKLAPLAASLQTEEIAIISARTLQDFSHRSIESILYEAKDSFDKQISEKPNLLRLYQSQYPEKPERSLEIMAYQVRLYQNRTGLEPSKDLIRTFIDTSLHLQYVEHSGAFKKAVDRFASSIVAPLEKEVVVAKALERSFMKCSLLDPEKDRITSLSARLEKAADLNQAYYNILAEDYDDKKTLEQEQAAIEKQDFEKKFKATVEKYDLSGLKVSPSENLRHATQALYTDMMSWEALLGGDNPTARRQAELFEKSIITHMLAPKIKAEFFSWHSPLEAKTNTETLGLIAAGMMQKHGNQYTLKSYLESAQDSMAQERNQAMPKLFKDYQSLYPATPDRVLWILVQQAFIVQHQCHYLLNQNARDTLLHASRCLDALEKREEVFHKIKTMVHEQIYTRRHGESLSTVNMYIEREFMRLMTRDPVKVSENLLNKDMRYAERCFDRAADYTQKTHRDMAQQEQILTKQKQQEKTLSKDKDLDRGFER